MTEPNPLLTESTLPFRYPPFDRIRTEHFAPAFEQGMAEHRREIQAIAQNPQPPSFENTVVAMEKAGALLSRTSRVFFGLNGSNTNPEMQKLQREMAPKLAAHSDSITLDPALFARVKALYDERDALGLDPESKRLLWRYHKDFVRAGALLSDADKEKLKALNAELASLGATFNQNVLKEVDASAVVVDAREELAGLSDAQIAAAADAARAAGREGKFLLRLTNTTGQAPLAALENRALRERVMEASLARGSRGGEFDNRGTAALIAKKRAERARLLGYPNHAAYQLDEQTAGSVEAVNKLLAQLGPPAVANARREAAEMQKIVRAEGGGFDVAAWDWAFYAEKVRKARYAFDESELKPYFELDRVLKDGVFYAAGRLYGLRFAERKDLPVYEPSVRVFDVFDRDGSPLALFVADYYARPNKNGGAWASAYVPQSALLGTKPVIANHLNIPKPPAGEPTLLTHDEVRTMFHEFGHALHGMFSSVRYPRFAGTSVPRDFVEYPSQVNEMWMSWPEVLQNYAKHYQTGAPIPQQLLDKVQAAEKFNQGFATTELVAANVIDQAWHQRTAAELPDADGLLAFEAKALADKGVDFQPVPPRYRSTYYSHIFAGGYSAGYYSYFWSEVLDAASVRWMKAHGGLTRENGDRFRATLLSRGGSEDAMTLYRNFTGGDPDVQPFLERRGLAAPAVPASFNAWFEPAEPVRIVGPIYFVGTADLGVYLLATKAGHVLIDGAMPGSAPLVLASIRKLGFEPKDIRILLITQAHVDHVGTLAHFKKLTGAQLAVMAPDDQLLESGGKADYLFGGRADFQFEPVAADRVLKDGDVVELGGLKLTARHTPGHTRGTTTWLATVEDGGKPYRVVFAGSTSVNPGTRLVKDASYPGIADDYRRSFRMLASLTPDIFLGAHAGFFDMDAKRRRAATEGVAAWVDPEGYKKHLAQSHDAFEALVAREAGSAPAK